MTDTELKHRLTADVEDIEAPSDLLDRVRLGGARRVRRRGLTAVGAGALAVAAVAAGVVAVPTLRDRAVQPPAATSTPWVDPIKAAPDDHYAILMKHDTGGDLAGDRAFLDQVLATWRAKQRAEHGKPGNPLSGNAWDAMIGEPRIYWAGTTPVGRMAIVVQHYKVPHPDPKVKYGLSGIHTLAGLVRDDGHGRLMDGGMVFPYDPSSYPVFSVRDPGKPSLAIVLGMGKRLAWGLTRDKPTPMKFTDGVAVNVIPEEIIERVRFWELPAR
ncbi:hypothetical protein AB0L70_01340 [Kribbella sp. NPDC051952]|uniref:hypothetical protein n=1 Tax=Kribbella sp. NPDC051952 TaxID=3154851 RepID=UPI00342CC8CF